jgi:hypothetical protein
VPTAAAAVERTVHSPSDRTSVVGIANVHFLVAASKPRRKPACPVASWLTATASFVSPVSRTHAVTAKPVEVSVRLARGESR